MAVTPMPVSPDRKPGRRRRWSSRLRRWLAGPEQGWSSVVLLAALLWVTGSSLDDALASAPAGFGPGRTGFLAALMVGAGLVGYLLARSRLPVGWADVLGAVIGAGVVLVVVSGAVSDAASLELRLRALSDSLAKVVQDITGPDRQTTEVSAGLLAVAAISWTTGLFAALSVFRRSSALPAVTACAVVLMVSLSVTARGASWQAPATWAAVIFAACALLLVLRLNLSRQREGWQRRHIADGRGVGALFLRGGFALVMVALVGAVGLAATASSRPLGDAWSSLGDRLGDFTLQLEQVLGARGQAHGGSVIDFGPYQAISGVWYAIDTPVFVASPDDGKPHRWRAGTYDVFDGGGWRQTAAGTVQQPVDEGSPLLEDSADGVDPSQEGYLPVDVGITAKASLGDLLLSPATPLSVDRDASVETLVAGGPFVTARLAERLAADGAYSVSSLVRAEPRAGGPYGNELAAAGVVYPWWAQRYTALDLSTIGPRTSQALDGIVNGLDPGRRDPYHLAVAIQAYLHDSDAFTYTTVMTNVCQSGERVTECLLRSHQGYCQYFATAMALMLRLRDVPARYVEGFLPGQLLDSGDYEVPLKAAHAWVEVWFPGYGWIEFDPTPGNFANGQEMTELPAGPAVGTPPREDEPLPTPDFLPPDDATAPLTNPVDEPGDLFSATVDRAPVLLAGLGIVLLVALLVGSLLLLVRLRRFPGGEPELAFWGISSLAARLGHGPRPAQTAYEYTAQLSQVVPRMKRDLQVVATASVESTYAQRPPRGTALAGLRRAYRRARVGLLRLLFRRSGTR